MDLGIAGKVALVGGASSGIGEAVALALAREGAKLAVAARRLDRLEDVARRARAQGAPDAAAFQADQTDPASLIKLAQDAEARLGTIEILIVNGGGPKPGSYAETGPGDWDAAYAFTLRSALRLVDAVLPGMRRRRWGRIVALESVSVKAPIPALVLSNAFRTAVVAALKTLSAEVAAEGITVNAIATGRIASGPSTTRPRGGRRRSRKSRCAAPPPPRNTRRSSRFSAAKERGTSPARPSRSTVA